MIPLTDDIAKGFRMRLNFVNPHKMDYDIEFVARTLGRIGRFNNISAKFLSVAEHCYNASFLFDENPLGALMHDAPEAFTGDCTTHLKMLLPGFKEIEQRIEEDMVRRFDYEPVDELFKQVDTALFYKEEELLFEDCHLKGTLPQLDVQFWPSDFAGQMFLKRFWQLKENGNKA